MSEPRVGERLALSRRCTRLPQHGPAAVVQPSEKGARLKLVKVEVGISPAAKERPLQARMRRR
eukprot:6202607-Pleurochrysis_carterae.AAC.1